MVLRAHDFEPVSLQALQEAERLDPADPRWPYLQGLTLLLTRPDDGLACLERASARADRPEPNLRLAEVLLARGRIEDAEAFARRFPSEARATVLLARAAAERGDWAGVLARTDALRTDSRCEKQVATLRGQALVRTGQAATGEAELRRAAGLPADPTWEDPYVRQTELLQVGQAADLREAANRLARGAAGEAIPLLERAMKRDPTGARPQSLYGRALLESGAAADSRAVFGNLILHHPTDVDGWFYLGVAESRLEHAKLAEAAFATTVRLKPDHALGHYNLAQARKALGDWPGAIGAAEEAVRCRPDFEPARQLVRELRGEK